MWAIASAFFLLASPASSIKVGSEAVPVRHNPKVLVFQAVQSSDEVAKLVKHNVDRLHAAGLDFDLVLAHYDENMEDFSKRIGEVWYNKNVKRSLSAPGYKMHLLRKFINEDSLDLNHYDWVWPIDEDMDLGSTNPKRLLLQARHSSAMVVGASYQQLAAPVDAESRMLREGGMRDERMRGEDDHYYPMNKPHPECRFRYSPMVSLEMPLIKPEVAKAIADCETCLSPGHLDSDFGLERMLCSWVSERFDRWATKTCAILDMQMVTHRNFQTAAPKKHTHGWSYVEMHNAQHFVDKTTAMIASPPGYDCVREPRMYEHRSVYCGAHRATTCDECPQNHGRDWCNGQCGWSDADSSCILRGSDKVGPDAE